MNLINRDDIHFTIYYPRMNGKRELADALEKAIKEAIFKLPVIDAEPVIRCKDCKWCRTFYHGSDMGFSYECAKLYLTGIGANDFCSKAERKDNA